MDLALRVAWGGLRSVVTLAIVVIPLMVLMQLARDYRVLERFLGFFAPFARLLGISRRAGLPLVVGLAFGLAYGAGIIVQTAREGGLSLKDRFLLVLFLVGCHAVVEDTLVFVAVGANGWVLLLCRLGTAMGLTALAARCLPDRVFRGLEVGEES